MPHIYEHRLLYLGPPEGRQPRGTEQTQEAATEQPRTPSLGTSSSERVDAIFERMNPVASLQRNLDELATYVSAYNSPASDNLRKNIASTRKLLEDINAQPTISEGDLGIVEQRLQTVLELQKTFNNHLDLPAPRQTPLTSEAITRVIHTLQDRVDGPDPTPNPEPLDPGFEPGTSVAGLGPNAAVPQ